MTVMTRLRENLSMRNICFKNAETCVILDARAIKARGNDGFSQAILRKRQKVLLRLKAVRGVSLSILDGH